MKKLIALLDVLLFSDFYSLQVWEIVTNVVKDLGWGTESITEQFH